MMNITVNSINRRRFIGALSAASAGMAMSGLTPVYGGITENRAWPDVSVSRSEEETLQLATFDVDATPPAGSYLAYVPVIRTCDLGLRAKGIVLTGAGLPVVLCAVDWIGICNESQDVFKQVLAAAARTVPERVAVHVLHQHDAPKCDFSAEKMLRDAGIEPKVYDGAFEREVLLRLGRSVEEGLTRRQPVTHLGVGKAQVHEVASNRRILGDDGKVAATRWTACLDPELRAKPEGLIDPELTLLSFWNQDAPLAVMTFYATHPQSYYRVGVPCPDFPGIARFYRQLAVPDALHIHFTGAGGNIGAGKYNDGTHENRLTLAKRLADGMEQAWKNVKKTKLAPEDIGWETQPVALPLAFDPAELHKRMEEAKLKPEDDLSELAWAIRQSEGNLIRIACLRLGQTRTLFMPGELFVEYQLAAKAARKDLTVAMAAYGEGGPGYIGTRAAYAQGGYEIEVSLMAPEVEDVLMDAVNKLLK
ncbi:MAG: hypothetical protein LBK22_05650 [Tannerella sp.]|jgi:hypothetical protein|nr:hypothetical protein [Tannerella sp.]